jgi:hypothetical protein
MLTNGHEASSTLKQNVVLSDLRQAGSERWIEQGRIKRPTGPSKRGGDVDPQGLILKRGERNEICDANHHLD